MIEIEHVSKIYGDSKALDGVTLTIGHGEFFVLVGRSGSGKTTLLKTLNRLIDPSQGTVRRDGQDLAQANLRQLRLDTGYVLQTGALFPNLTVLENIELIPELKKWDKKERRDKAKALLDRVGLPAETYADRKPSQLSGGEQQRVGILRALISQPGLILMDEPFSALDPVSRENLQDLVKDLHEEFGMTVVFVTHDMQEAQRLADRIGVMQAGQLLQVGTPEEILAQPANDSVRELFKGGQA